MQYFKKLQQLLDVEKEADLASFHQASSQQDIGQKRTIGQLWYPIAIKDQELGRGDYLSVEVVRTTHLEVPHQFRYGVQAALFSNHDITTHRIEGTVIAIGENWIKISFRIDELPDWTDNGKLGLEMLFDQYSYEEMQKSLKEAEKQETSQILSPLSQVLIGNKAPRFNENKDSVASARLNEVQQQAVNHIASATDIALVHGPPGTGKTTTLVEAIKVLLAKGTTQLLVTAPSNAAVDVLTEKLAEEKISVIRVGNPARVSKSLLEKTLDHQIRAHVFVKDNQKLKKQAAQLRDMAHKYKRKFGSAERAQRKALFASARDIMKELEANEAVAIDTVLNNAQVITATLVGTNHPSIRKRTFHTLIIDEAAQALEPACWIPILRTQKLIMAGDHQQLPPTIKSSGKEAKALMHTLMQKCIERYPDTVVSLQEQYRMHASIMDFPSQQFYANSLQAHPSVATRKLFMTDLSVQFVDTAGCGFEEKNKDNSIYNPEEASFTVRLLAQYLHQLSTGNILPTVGLISPYRAQVSELKEQASASPLASYDGSLSANTIDSFQGQERDVICISLCRSNTEGTIGFLADIRRMNVAMTRARKKLLIIGDSSTLTVHPFYRDFIKFCEDNGFYQSAWEYMEY